MEHSLTRSMSTLTEGRGRRGLLLDFANIFKGFIGTNYLGAAFIFSQSGLVLGVVGALLVSSLAAHCCLLIVKCKNLAIHKLLESHEDWLNSTIEAVENPSRHKLRKRVERRLTYSDIAWIAAGKWGSMLVTGMLLFTQFGFCIAYYIFLGNTIRKFFPAASTTISFAALTLAPAMVMNSTTLPPSNVTGIFPTDVTVTEISTELMTTISTDLPSEIFPPDLSPRELSNDLASVVSHTSINTQNSNILPISTNDIHTTQVLHEFLTSSNTAQNLQDDMPTQLSVNGIKEVPNNNSTTKGPSNATTATTTINTSKISTNSTTEVPRNSTTELPRNSTTEVPTKTPTVGPIISTSAVPTNLTTVKLFTTDSSGFEPSQGYGGPLYYWFVVSLIPIFATFGLLRSIRHLAPGSMFSNFTIIFGFVTVLSIILSSDFHISDTVKLANWSTFPIFFGGISSNFEGIGVIIPIESSMGENRRYFPYLLIATISMVTTILSTIGILGYLKYGVDVQQIILWSLPPDSTIVIILNAVIVLGVLFTFPLQNFPVIEICENFLFADGKVFGPPKKVDVDDDFEHLNPGIQSEPSPLLDTIGEEMDPEFAEILKKLPVAVQISESVAPWKRNVLRITIVISEALFALALKDDYTYFGSLIGAIGATTLGYIMPCFLHIKLTRQRSTLVMAKDVTIIVIGCLGGIAGVYVSISDIVNSF